MGQIPQNTALIIIDVQRGFDDPAWGQRNNPDAEANIATILKHWRETNRPLFHIRHDSVMPKSPLRPGQSGNDFKPEVTPLPNEPIVTKNVNSAFIGTDLKQQLDDAKIEHVVIVGLTTNHCVSTTTRMAGNFGFKTYLLSDATATFDRVGISGEVYPAEQVHHMSLANLNDEFATVLTTADLLAKLDD